MASQAKHWIIGNWKSNKTSAEISSWLQEIQQLEVPESTVTVIAPPFPYLSQVAATVQAQPGLTLGAQDISPYPAGSYTGAVNGSMLKDFGVAYAIVGHSERRKYFHETHQDVANKIDQCLINQITPIVCVDAEYMDDQYHAMSTEHASRCLVAYEPLSAIGTGNNEALDKVTEVTKQIKQLFGDVPVLYGGSVNGANAREYLLATQGFIVGTDSLRATDFMAVVRATLPQ